jgi:hypothetical protein
MTFLFQTAVGNSPISTRSSGVSQDETKSEPCLAPAVGDNFLKSMSSQIGLPEERNDTAIDLQDKRNNNSLHEGKLTKLVFF